MEQSNGLTEELIYYRRGNGLDIRVEQSAQFRWLVINGQRQSQLDLTAPTRAIYPYVQQFMQALTALTSHNILQIGLGAGELNRCILSKFPEATLTSIESEAAIVDIYQQFFQLPETKAREQLKVGELPDYTSSHFDCVILDIYPWPNPHNELLLSLMSRLHATGLLLLNLPHPELGQEVNTWCQSNFHDVKTTQNPGYQNQLFHCSKPK